MPRSSFAATSTKGKLSPARSLNPTTSCSSSSGSKGNKVRRAKVRQRSSSTHDQVSDHTGKQLTSRCISTLPGAAIRPAVAAVLQHSCACMKAALLAAGHQPCSTRSPCDGLLASVLCRHGNSFSLPTRPAQVTSHSQCPSSHLHGVPEAAWLRRVKHDSSNI
jgi:hypothetical protein